jgi:zinc protease
VIVRLGRAPLLVGLMLLCGCAPPARGPSVSPGARLIEKLAIPPLTVKVPRVGREVERTLLPNGMVLYLASDPGSATFDLFATFRAGRLYRDGVRPAVGEATAYLLRSGGTTTLSHQRVAEELERLGISVDVTTGMEMLSFTVTALDRHADQAVALLADMFRHPAFDPMPLQAFKGQVLDLLRRLPDSPGQLLPRQLARLLYTEEHPGGRFATPADVRRIDREDLLSFWRRFIRPDNGWIAAVGNAPIAELRKRLQDGFEAWSPPGPLAIAPPPPMRPRSVAGVYFLPRAVPQASVLLGHLGVARGNPDRHAIELLNLILGGNGFSSRLVGRLRTREGLAYAVGSSFPTTNPSGSLFRVSVQTASEKAPRAIRAVQEEMRRLQDEPVSLAELAAAKDFLTNNFAFRFSSRLGTLRQLLSLELQGRPPDDLETLLDRFRAVTPADVQRAARQYLHPDEMTILVMGGPTELADRLRVLGPVRPFVASDFSE